MADVSDVGNALVAVLVTAVYPSGTGAASVGNCPIAVYQGWPDPQQLTDALSAGGVHISVFPRPGDKVTGLALGDTGWSQQANNGTTGTSTREVRRQSRDFQITVWAGCYGLRDTVAKAVDTALAVIRRLSLPDGSMGVMTYINSIQDDNSQKQGIYRRDLFYAVNYALAQQSAPADGYVIKQATLTTSISTLPL